MSPRTEQQYEEIRQEKTQLIMESALELFASNGFENTSISQIAKKAKISKGLLYNYFESKEDLIEAILNKGIDDMLNVFDPNKDGTLEIEEMKFFISEAFRLIKENRIFWRLYFAISFQPSVFKLIEKRIEEMYEPIMKMMVNYFTSMGYENPMMESIIFGAVMDGISIDYVMKPDIYPFEEVKNDIINRYCKPKIKKK